MAFFSIKEYVKTVILENFIIRTLLNLVIESAFIVITVFVLTWKLNLSLTRLWKSNWKSYLAVNLLASTFLLQMFSPYIIEFITSCFVKETTYEGSF